MTRESYWPSSESSLTPCCGKTRKIPSFSCRGYCKVPSFVKGCVLPGIHSGPDALSFSLCFGYGCNILFMSLSNKSKPSNPKIHCCLFLPVCFGYSGWVAMCCTRCQDDNAAGTSLPVGWRSESKLEKLVLQQSKVFSSQSSFGSDLLLAGAKQNVPVKM